MGAITTEPILPVSILDTDLYKLTMQQAVLHHFPNTRAAYTFTHRDKDRLFSRQTAERFERNVSHFGRLVLTPDERTWLQKKCPYLKPAYLDHLASYRFKPEQVQVRFTPADKEGQMGHIAIEVTGPWVDTIMWEVPLLACLSETHFTTADTDWTIDGQEELASSKAEALLRGGCRFSDFGTRRRRSYATQDLVVREMAETSRQRRGPGGMGGTSNVHLALKYDLTPVGTIAHEWYMGVAALKGYENCNTNALALWEEVYGDALTIALTDTFSTEVFFKDFVNDVPRAKRWMGLRQDSGDPFVYAPRAKAVYDSMGIDPKSKTIIFSDALDTDKALRLKAQCDDLGIPCTFGIGTFLTNDFRTASSGGREKSKALNMVIKLSAVNGKPVVKISDDIEKNTGDQATVKAVKETFGLKTH